jgi:hypothetical protein
LGFPDKKNHNPIQLKNKGFFRIGPDKGPYGGVYRGRIKEIPPKYL